MEKLTSFLFYALFMMGTLQTFGQGTSINSTGSPPDSSAMLDVSSSSKGALIPRMTLAQRVAIHKPVQGLIIYNTDCNELEYYTGNGWLSVMSSASILAPVSTAATGATQTAFTANWGSVTGATAYYLDVSSNAAFATFLPGDSNLSVGNVTSYNVTGLSCGVTYYYRVRSSNGCQVSLNSNTINASPTCLISFDAFDIGGGLAASPLNISHTCSGNNRLLLVAVHSQSGDIDPSNGVSYNGVGCTFLTKVQCPISSDWLYMYYLINPASGMNTCTVTYTGTSSIGARVVSYDNASQLSQPDVFTQGTKATTTTYSNSVTVGTNNSWVISWLRNGCSNITGTSNLVMRENNSFSFGDSNGPAAVGSFNQQATGTSCGWGYIQLAIKPLP